MKEANNENLFANPSELDHDDIDAKRDFTAKLTDTVPEGKGTSGIESTVEVRFCTGGRLSAPPVLHFRDYTLQASQALADIPTTRDHLPIIVKILNSMVVEDFDCGLLHQEEAKEVLLNVYGKWWGNKLSGFRYLLNPDLEGEALLAKENISYADIPLSALEVVPLDPSIKEPINIVVNGITVRFVFPRIRNTGIVTDLLNEKFAVEEQRFYKIKQMVDYNLKQTDIELKKELNLHEVNEYKEYLAEKTRMRLLYIRAQEICGVEDQIFETLDERIQALTEDSRISLRHWHKYYDFLEGKGKFGLEEEVEFYSDILEERIRRPFLFYTWNFIPTGLVEREGDGDDSISFG